MDCRITNKELKEYFTWKNYPMLNSCTTTNIEDDVFYDFGLGVSKIGLIQQTSNSIPDVLYKESHNSSIGNIWNEHNKEFVKFLNLSLERDKKVCEIGSGNGKIVNMLRKDIDVDCYDPSPVFLESGRIKIFKKYFTSDKKYDVVFCSHTLEHILDLKGFLETVKNSLNEFGKFVFSVPDSEYGFNNNILTTLNTEHIYYFSESSIRNTLTISGFKISKLEKFDNHSLFVTCVVDDSDLIECVDIDIEKFSDQIKSSTQKINNLSSSYIFGCHMMSSIFLHFNKNNNVVGVVDNDEKKHGKRLYGTNLICSPVQKNVKYDLILNGGLYHSEIESGLIDYCKIHSWKSI